MRLRLGTRGSALAVAQSTMVARRLRARGHDVELVRIKTGGDVAKGSLTRLGSLGVFAAELRAALLDDACDLAVHSFKDLPTEPVRGLLIAAVPPRADARDALCARDSLGLADLPPGSTIGTGSPRRVAQLRALRPDLSFVDVRGNLGTRLARVGPGDLDAIVLAVAGLQRLGRMEAITDYLDILPSPGQGALAVECRAGDAEIIAEVATLDDPQTRLAVDAERTVLAGLGGGCAAPVGAWARDGELNAGVFALDGTASAVTRVSLSERAGETAAEELLIHGAAQVADLNATRESRLAELHDDSSLWGGEEILAGVRVFLPRPEGDMAETMRAAGAEVVAEPVQERILLEPEGSLDGAHWVALTSAATLEAMAELGMEIPPGAKVAAVGGATAEAARAAGIEVSLVPNGVASAAALAAAWPEGEGRVVIPGSALSSTVLADGLRMRGYTVEQIPVYTVTALDALPERVVEDWTSGVFDVVVITSGSVGAAVGELLGWPQGTAVVAFGPPSATALRRLGVRVAAVAETQDAAGVIRAIAALGKGEP